MATVLVVDDDADIVTFLKINLELDGHEVSRARRSRQAAGSSTEIDLPASSSWPVIVCVQSRTRSGLPAIGCGIGQRRAAPSSLIVKKLSPPSSNRAARTGRS